MDIQAHEDGTGYAPASERWYAIDADTYDGAPDGNNVCGTGSTAKAAIMELLDILLDDGEITHDEQRELFRIHLIDPREVGYDG